MIIDDEWIEKRKNELEAMKDMLDDEVARAYVQGAIDLLLELEE